MDVRLAVWGPEVSISLDPIRSTGWPVICNRHRREESCLFSRDAWYWYLLCGIEALLPRSDICLNIIDCYLRSLVCTICYSHHWSPNFVLGIRVFANPVYLKLPLNIMGIVWCWMCSRVANRICVSAVCISTVFWRVICRRVWKIQKSAY
jgi:hypothetical protein